MEWRLQVSKHTIRQVTVNLPNPDVHARHPFKNAAAHEKLLAYCTVRLDLAKPIRDKLVDRYVTIDQQVAGWVRLNQEDEKRKAKQDATGRPQAVEMNLPITYVHLDDMETYLTQIFAPTKGMYNVKGNAAQQEAARPLTILMNNHAVHGDHYRQIAMATWNILKYNLGGLNTYWSREFGTSITSADGGEPKLNNKTLLWEGNRIESIDMYNVFFDPTVLPTQVHDQGEFVAQAKPISFFRLQKLASDGIYFNVKKLLARDLDSKPTVVFKYYRDPPTTAKMSPAGIGLDSGENWLAFLGTGDGVESDIAFELVHMYISLNPVELSLIANTTENRTTREIYEIWRITIANGDTIIETVHMANAHGWLPYGFGMINEDLMGLSQKSIAEILAPLQSFASFALNTHIQATRKNIWDLIVYDPSAVDLSKIPEGEVAARIPLKPAARGKDIRTAIWQNSNLIDTKQTVQDMKMVMDLLQIFYPTQSLPSQIAGIDRAIESQVAAVEQGANRRLQRSGRTLDETMLKVSRTIQYLNILQFQKTDTIRDEAGTDTAINPTKLRELDMTYIIGHGLRTIDREVAARTVEGLVQQLLRSQVAQQFDMAGMLDYVAALRDADVDLKQFARKQPQQISGANPSPAGGDQLAGNSPQGIIPDDIPGST